MAGLFLFGQVSLRTRTVSQNLPDYICRFFLTVFFCYSVSVLWRRVFGGLFYFRLISLLVAGVVG